MSSSPIHGQTVSTSPWSNHWFVFLFYFTCCYYYYYLNSLFILLDFVCGRSGIRSQDDYDWWQTNQTSNLGHGTMCYSNRSTLFLTCSYFLGGTRSFPIHYQILLQRSCWSLTCLWHYQNIIYIMLRNNLFN